MQQAIGAGNVADIQNLLTKRFPGLQFEALSDQVDEIEKPEEAAAEPTPVGEQMAKEVEKEETTASLYGDYVNNLPEGVRGLVTTDYKGVRGSRLGRGNYSTASIIPGAQVSTPAPVTTPSAPTSSASAPSYTTTTYNYTYNYPQEQPTVQPTKEIESGDAAPVQTGGGFTPAWAKSNKQQSTTTKQASAGLVPSTTQRGTYVAPSSPQASTTAQNVSQAVTSRVESGSGFGIKAAAGAAGDPNRLGTNAVAAIIAAPGSDRKAAEATLRKFEKGKIDLTNEARKALEKLVK